MKYILNYIFIISVSFAVLSCNNELTSECQPVEYVSSYDFEEGETYIHETTGHTFFMFEKNKQGTNNKHDGESMSDRWRYVYKGRNTEGVFILYDNYGYYQEYREEVWKLI